MQKVYPRCGSPTRQVEMQRQMEALQERRDASIQQAQRIIECIAAMDQVDLAQVPDARCVSDEQ